MRQVGSSEHSDGYYFCCKTISSPLLKLSNPCQGQWKEWPESVRYRCTANGYFFFLLLCWHELRRYKIQCSNPFHPPSWSEVCSFSLYALTACSWSESQSSCCCTILSFFYEFSWNAASYLSSLQILILTCKLRSSFLAAQMITIL